VKLLVYPHELSISGSPINAVDLAAEVRALGHDVIVYGQPGPLVDYVTGDLGLDFVPARTMRFRPAPSRIAQLAAIVRRERIDVIHAYEWPPCLDALYGASLVGGVPIVCSILSMAFAPLIPSTVPLLMGTHDLADGVRRVWKGEVGVMEPPIDTRRDNPTVDGKCFRSLQGVAADERLVVSVSRLAIDLKLDALVDAIDAVSSLADRFRVRLVLVGDGPAAGHLRERAAAVNRSAGRTVVSMPGALLDPRPAYAAADVVLGMGGSALRGMAFGKPVIVQGEQGFARRFDETTAAGFLWSGFYGIGPGGSGAPVLAAELGRLLPDPALRSTLGCLGLKTVRERFKLGSAAERLEELYARVVHRGRPLPNTLAQAALIGGRALTLEARMHVPRHKRARLAHDARRLASARAF
jgi:L-malate glycosyltransferase